MAEKVRYIDGDNPAERAKARDAALGLIRLPHSNGAGIYNIDPVTDKREEREIGA